MERPAGMAPQDAVEGGGSPPEVLAGVVDRVLFERAETGYRVLRVRAAGEATPVVVVGVLPPAEPGELIRAEGTWYNDKTWGRQFRAGSVSIAAPASEAGLVAYLGSGRIKGIGEELAKRLVEHFGTRLGEIIEKEPARLREVEGVGPKIAARLREAWQGQRRARETLMFLAEHGLSQTRAARILDAYGLDAIATVRRDPYRLARDIRGIGFATADEIALRLGVAPDSPQRTGAAMAEVLRVAADEGHTALPRHEARSRLAELLDTEPSLVDAGIARELEAGRLVELVVDEREHYLMLSELDRAEETVASRLVALATGTPPWNPPELIAAIAKSEAALGVALAASQQEAIARAVHSKLLVITGGPGTGKTTLVRGILAALDEPDLRVVLAAPTGRAARRLAESTGREARTLHRLLEADPEHGCFRRHAGRPLEADLVVVDEASMIDTQLLSALLQALPEEAALLLVGDVDQLPSIGPGQVLADLIASGVLPVIRLAEIFRQAAESGIVRNAHRINRGEVPVFARPEDGQLADFYGIRVAGPEDAEEKLVELVTERIPQRFGLDPLSEVQVLTPMNRGRMGTQSLNEILQRRLNPSPFLSLVRGQTRFSLGDKVMQLENDYEREVYNGDIGRITGLDPKAQTLEVTMDGRPLTYGADELDQLALAYAVTVHKAQGSEYPAVVVPLLRQHGRMLRRNLLYTAITRARALVVLLTEPDALERAVWNTTDLRRTTLLRQRLIDKGSRV
ncbi:ATP-dependent RecD-like DNA helicase [Benzoatithermus flavus]|uniref:ATP-dependent RecD2 DNA helicase n=1 Tax=Benzoatithermus flavus TaxID=3108223 RepID=A0ABU8XK63_9PROT